MNSQVRNIEEILRKRFQPTFLEVLDDSAKHAGHAGARQGGGGHYQVTVVAEQFSGKSLVDQHRMVNESLKELFGGGIHARALQTYTPAQWQERKKAPQS